MIEVSPLRVWIADDEELIRRSIRRTLGARHDLVIVGESASGSETVSSLAGHAVDLLLLDVQMPEGSGFDVVAAVGPGKMPAVIFITAFDQYAVRAFEVHAIDYLLKPFDEDRLNRSFDRAQEQLAAKRGTAVAQQLQALLAGRPERWPDRLAVRSGERFDFVPIASIDWIESADNYVLVHCGSREHLLTETLTALTARLDPARFVRIQRGRVVNTAKVASICLLLGGTYEVQLEGGTRLTSGRQYRHEIMKLLGR